MLKLFALDATKEFAERVAVHLGTSLGLIEELEFADGERKVRATESLRGQDVYAIQSLYADPRQSIDDKLVRLLFLIGALHECGAQRVTAVIPYLAYGRQDRQTTAHDPVTTRYLAKLLESAGADAIVTLDVHNLAAYQNAFRRPAWHLDSRRVFVEHLGTSLGKEPLVIASPDIGGVKRAQLFSESLAAGVDRPVGFAFMEKRRIEGVLSGGRVVGDVADATVIIVDDMIATGGTMARAIGAFVALGAKRVLCIASHGLFAGDATGVVERSKVDRWIVSDTIPPFRLPVDLVASHLEVVGTASLFADAIRCLHEGGSLTDLSPGTGAAT